MVCRSRLLVAALNAGDLQALDRVFTSDIVIEWPQSRERSVGAENRREIYSRFPSLPHVTPRRVIGCDDVWTIEASLDYGTATPTCASSSSRCAVASSLGRRATGRSRFRPRTGAPPGSRRWSSLVARCH
jgi:hypothetical protein